MAVPPVRAQCGRGVSLLSYRKDEPRPAPDVAAMPLPDPPPAQHFTLRARWVFPADGPPIPGGRVTIRAGRITDVAPDGPTDCDLGEVALLPGLVNAHTHLDLGGLRGRCPPTPDLTAWLGRVI